MIKMAKTKKEVLYVWTNQENRKKAWETLNENKDGCDITYVAKGRKETALSEDAPEMQEWSTLGAKKVKCWKIKVGQNLKKLKSALNNLTGVKTAQQLRHLKTKTKDEIENAKKTDADETQKTIAEPPNEKQEDSNSDKITEAPPDENRQDSNSDKITEAPPDENREDSNSETIQEAPTDEIPEENSKDSSQTQNNDDQPIMEPPEDEVVGDTDPKKKIDQNNKKLDSNGKEETTENSANLQKDINGTSPASGKTTTQDEKIKAEKNEIKGKNGGPTKKSGSGEKKENTKRVPPNKKPPQPPEKQPTAHGNQDAENAQNPVKEEPTKGEKDGNSANTTPNEPPKPMEPSGHGEISGRKAEDEGQTRKKETKTPPPTQKDIAEPTPSAPPAPPSEKPQPKTPPVVKKPNQQVSGVVPENSDLLAQIRNGKKLKTVEPTAGKPVASVQRANLTNWPNPGSDDDFEFTAVVPEIPTEGEGMLGSLKSQISLINGLKNALKVLEKKTDTTVEIAQMDMEDLQGPKVGQLLTKKSFTISVSLNDETWTEEKVNALKNIVENMPGQTKFTFEDKAQQPKKTAARPKTAQNRTGGRPLPAVPKSSASEKKGPETNAGSNGTWECPGISGEYKGDRVVILVRYSSIKNSKSAKDHVPTTTYTDMTTAKLTPAMMKLFQFKDWKLKGENGKVVGGKDEWKDWNAVIRNPIKLTYKSGEKRSTREAECWMLLVPKKDYTTGWEKNYKQELADMGLAIRHINEQVSERKMGLAKGKS